MIKGMVERKIGAIVTIGSGATIVVPSHHLYAIYAANKAVVAPSVTGPNSQTIFHSEHSSELRMHSPTSSTPIDDLSVGGDPSPVHVHNPTTLVAVLPLQPGAVSSSMGPVFSVGLVGFTGGFGHVEGVYLSHDSESLTHPPRFSQKLFFGDDNFSEGSVNKNYLNIEVEKTLEVGETIGFDMDVCYSKVKNVIEGEIFNKT
ncbi:unnamed protein product [Lactuca saligna]|uniref:Uncharacterized protein n=1 Tax=Lactuca saligna TaxID=75948 RepID=A0AA36E817_LACSI|nr:unnamed protein product [Lactuca saligna]